MLSLVLVAAAQTVLADIPERSVQKALAKARPVATCVVGPDCDAKWSRARHWIADNSRFTLIRDTDDTIVTRFAVYANTDASYAVKLDAPIEGRRTIRFRAWCGNFVACFPSPTALTKLFVAELDRQ